MSQRISRTDLKRQKRNRRLITLGWIVGLTTIVIVLLYKEKADWLYVLATVGLTVLLLIVALADLHGEHTAAGDAEVEREPVLAGGKVPATTQAAATAPSDWRGGKGRRK
jgi:peptidoglycan/LPS O-acetylase OafA/YrhL